MPPSCSVGDAPPEAALLLVIGEPPERDLFMIIPASPRGLAPVIPELPTRQKVSRACPSLNPLGVPVHVVAPADLPTAVVHLSTSAALLDHVRRHRGCRSCTPLDGGSPCSVD